MLTANGAPSDIAAVGMRVLWDLPVAMDDGIELRANVYLPPKEGAYPVVMAMTDYAKDLPFCQGYPEAWAMVVRTAPDAARGTSTHYISFEAPDPEKWVIHDYAVVVVDSRGIGRSPGTIDSFSAREGDDYATAVDWAGEQPWCDGNVGLLGMSYLGVSQWLCASRQPRHLKGIIPWMALDDYLRQTGYHGGIPCTFFRTWTTSQVTTVQHGLGSHGPRNEFTGTLVCGDEDLSDEERDANIVDSYRQAMQHPLDDGFYDGRRAVWDKITVPILSVTSWAAVGVHLRGNVEALMNAASGEKWLAIRKEHGVFAALYEDAGVSLQRRFFDHVLKGVGDFAETQPKVELAIRDVEDRLRQTRAENEWPLARTRWTRLYLDPRRAALDEAAPPHDSSATYRGFSKGITLLTEPFTAQTEITGPLAAKLWISASSPDADIFLAVRVFDEQGTEKLFHGMPDPRIPLTQGWLRASQRELDDARSLPYRPFLTHKTVKPLWPGEVYELDIEILPACVVIPPGYRLGLSVLGQDFEHDAEPTEWAKAGIIMRGSSNELHDDPLYRPADIYDNEVTVYSGPDRESYLLLPIIPSS
jgi:predicted acyl esterase